MKSREKAKELVANYYQEFIKDYQVLACMSDEIRHSIYKKRETFSKKCALIAVDEILNNFGTLTEGKQHYAAYSTIKFYEEVKQEIEEL